MYLQWDCDSELQPALHLWLQELGSNKVQEVLQSAPNLLERNPAEVFMWLLLSIPYTGECHKEPRNWLHTRSFGVDAALVQRKQPEVMLQKLNDVRKTIDSVRWNADFTELQLCSFLHHHCLALLFSGDHVVDVLRSVAKALQLPMTSAGVRKTILLAHPQLFGMSAAPIEQRMLYCCRKYGSQEKWMVHNDNGVWYSHGASFSRETKMRTEALEHGIPLAPEATMQSTASELQRMLGWQNFELKQAVRDCPALLTCPTATVAQNFLKLRERHESWVKYGFSDGKFEVKADCSYSVEELLGITD